MVKHLAIAVLLTPLLTLHFAAAGDLPDPTLTPGAWRDDVSLAQICDTKWGEDERMVTDAMKRQVMAEYHMTPAQCPSGKIEIDHLVSRELGGADAVKNLWPQCYEAKVLDPAPANVTNFDPATGKLKTIDQKNPLPAYDKKKQPDGVVYLPPSLVAEFGAHKKDRLENDFGNRICLAPTDPQFIALDAARSAETGNWELSYIERYGDPRVKNPGK